MEFVQRYRALKEEKEIVMTEKWWTQLRFGHFGSELKRVMEAQPAIMK
jgi:hypothetical protein